MVKIALCDDELPFLQMEEKIIRSYGDRAGVPMEIAVYTDGGQLSYDVEEGQHVDLLFLDIEMPGPTGIELARRMRSLLPEILILFVTSHVSYAVKAYELSLFRYLPKSEIAIVLPLALEDGLKLLEKKDAASYLIETSRKVQKIVISDILYLYKSQKYAVLVLENEEIHVRKSLGLVQKELDREEFLQIERGYIVNLCQVTKMDGSSVVMKNGAVLPVSGSLVRHVREQIICFWRKRL